MRKREILFEDRLGLFQENKAYYLFLLIALLALIGVFPLFAPRGVGSLFLSLVLIITLLTGAIVLSKHRINRILSAAAGSLMVTTFIIDNFFYPSDLLDQITYAAGVIFFLHVSVVLLYDIFSYREKVVIGLLYGAISVYLLIGISFAFGFSLVEITYPGSFKGAFEETGLTSKFSSMMYFSFITLTTLGYGDISPLSRQAVVLSYLEAIGGQMYLTILVPRLVGMYLSRGVD